MGSQVPCAHWGREDNRARTGVAECSVPRVLSGAHFTSAGKKKEGDLSETSGLVLRFNYFAEPHGGTWLLQNMRCSDEPD